MNKDVIVDVDGFLADFISMFQQKFGYDRPELESLEARYPQQARSINAYVNNPSTYKDLEPLPLGLSIVQWLNKNGFDVHVVSSRPVTAEWVTRRWLAKHNIKYLSFGIHPDKVPYIVYKNPLCAVDDMMSIHKALKRYNIPCIVVVQPWNAILGKIPERIATLDEFIHIIKQIKEKKDNL